MQLSSKDTKYLKGLAHSLNPVIMMGQKGLSDTLLEEAKIAIGHHELIKVKLNDGKDKGSINTLAETLDAHIVQVIGRILILYKPNRKDPKIILPR